MLAGSLAALASCMPSPRAACIQSAEVEVDFINSAIRNFGQQISGRTAVIDRGYAIHSRQEKTLYIDKCEAEDGEEYNCRKYDIQTVKTPVSISIPEERRKRRELESQLNMERAKLSQAYARRDKAIKGCQSLPDE
jgi:hypothetical protein|tara:strand:- start:394 stop:801 length:408 start_codon:yes stop_codon:yes gene_type:complete